MKNEEKLIIEEILSGRTSSFSILIDRYKDGIFNLAFRICGNREDAEEITQDTFLKAFRSLSGFRKDSSFGTWLYRIAFNTTLTNMRKRTNQPGYLDEMSDFVHMDIWDGSDKSDHEERSKEIVNTALKSLSGEERAIITLFYFDEKMTEEIADITGLSISNVKVKLFRARNKMKIVIENLKLNEYARN